MWQINSLFFLKLIFQKTSKLNDLHVFDAVKNYRNKGKWFIFALKNDSYLYSRRIHMCFQKGFIFALKNGFIFALKKDSYLLSRRIHMCSQEGFVFALKNYSYLLLRISNNWNMRALIIFEICIVRKMLRIILWSLNLVMSKINLQRLFKVEKNRWRCLR